MLNRLIKLLYNVFKTKEHKPTVLIFGASKGGESVYRSIQSEYNVVGFVDNNTKIQGSKLLRKKIYTPDQLRELIFDKIIIASDYHVEIKKQLIDEFGINSDEIFIFDLVSVNEPTVLFKFFDSLERSVIYFLCHTPFVFSHLLLTFISSKDSKYKVTSLKKITWLDQLKTHRVKVFLPEKITSCTSPNFIAEKSKTSSIIIPEVSLYQFKKGVIMTNVNAIIFGENDIAIGRVPSFPVEKSQYDSGFLALHGTNNALVKEYPIAFIEKGIAIVGSNDGNYYHWVIEVLSKFEFIAQLPKKYDEFPILISEKVLEIESIKEFLSYLNITRQFIYLESCIEYQVNDLLFIGSPNYFVANIKNARQWSVASNFIRESSLKYLRDSVINAFQSRDEIKTPSKVFLARKGIIRDYNQAEVFDLLSQYGFEAVYLEDLSLFQQVRLMQNAAFIVGPTGAAWTNLIFCNTGTQALCWMAEEIGDFSCFADLGQFSGVNLEYLRYKVGSQISKRSLYYAAYTISIKCIKLWLVAKGLNEVIKGNVNDIN